MDQGSSAREGVGVETSPEFFRSVMTVIDLNTLWGFCFILAKFHVVLINLEERVHNPPSWLCGGLRRGREG